MNSLAVKNNEVDSFGYPMSNRECNICSAKMYRVAEVDKTFNDMKKYGFVGYKCFRCGKEDIVHEKGGVLGNVE